MSFVAAKINKRFSEIKVSIYHINKHNFNIMTFSSGFIRHFKIKEKYIEFYYDTDSDKIGFKFHTTNLDKSYLKVNRNISLKGLLNYCNLDINNYSGIYNSDAITQENNMFILDPSKRITK